MEPIAYLTKYEALLCKDCALNTDGLIDDGSRWLSGLTAVPVTEVLQDWPDARCEECERSLALAPCA